jgi:DUF971 family protein
MSSADDTPRPETLQRLSQSEIAITWSTGVTKRYTAKRLRDACPCATCREKRRGDASKRESDSRRPLQLPVLSATEAQPLTIERLRPVGNYAYNIAFGDGHDSGIFTLEFLYEIGTD